MIVKPVNKKGFTLIELLVVVAIIGILAAVGVVAYNGYTAGAKKTIIKNNHNAFVKKVALVLQECNINGSVSLKKNSPSGTKLDQSVHSVDCYGGNKWDFFVGTFRHDIHCSIHWFRLVCNCFQNWTQTR